MVVAEFSIFPFDKGESLSSYVARVVKIIDASGLDYTLHTMGTNLEGEYDQVMKVIRDCFLELQKDCNRISVAIKIDYRNKPAGRIKSKTEKVEKITGLKLAK